MVETARQLEALGHKCTLRWWDMPNPKPYSENTHLSEQLASEMHEAVFQAESFILLWEPTLYGALIELGMAMMTLRHREPIFIVGSERESIFFQLPGVEQVKTVEELLEKVGTA